MPPALRSLAVCIAAATVAVTVISTAPQSALGQDPPKNFIVHDAAKPVAVVTFTDAQGQSRSLADFKGRVVLLNLWATWCGPCRKEMSGLNRLQAQLGGRDFEVLALSIDRGGIEVVRKFFVELGIRNLGIYLDTGGKAMRELGAVGLPLTLLVGHDGLEIGRLIGPAEWDSPDAIAFLRLIVAESGAGKPKQGSAPPANTDLPSGQP